MRLLQKSLIILAALSFCGCGNMPIPVKPKIEMGVLDVPAGQVITNKLNTAKITSAAQLSYKALVKGISASPVRVPLLDYDKAIAIKPGPWAQLEDYRGALEDYVRNHCH